MSTNSGDEPAGVSGWLLLLSRLLIVWQPLNLAIAGMGALGAMGVRGPAVAIILVARTTVTAAGVAAGLALSNRHAGAVGRGETQSFTSRHLSRTTASG
jgi:hypothetical protein